MESWLIACWPFILFRQNATFCGSFLPKFRKHVSKLVQKYIHIYIYICSCYDCILTVQIESAFSPDASTTASLRLASTVTDLP